MCLKKVQSPKTSLKNVMNRDVAQVHFTGKVILLKFYWCVIYTTYEIVRPSLSLFQTF